MKLSDKFKDAITNIVYDKNGDYIYESDVRDLLDEITPKVTIDFVKWTYNSDYLLRTDNKWAFYDDPYGDKIPLKTDEELFQEFLKTYNP